MTIFLLILNTFLLYKIWALNWFIPYLGHLFSVVFVIQLISFRKIHDYKFLVPFTFLAFLLVFITFPSSANHYFILFYLYLGILLAKIFKEDYKRVVSVVLGTAFLMAGIGKTLSEHYRSGSFIGQSILSQRLYGKIIPDKYIALSDKEQVELYKHKKIKVKTSPEFKMLIKVLVFLSITYQLILAFLLIFNINHYTFFFVLHYAITILGTTEYIFGTILCLCFYLLTNKKYYLLFVLSLLILEFL